MAFWGATFFFAVGLCRVMSLEKKKFQLKKRQRYRKNHRRGHRTRARTRINITPQTYGTEEVCICVCCYSSMNILVVYLYVPSISSSTHSKIYGRVYVFPSRGDLFLFHDQGLEFYISLRENSTNQY